MNTLFNLKYKKYKNQHTEIYTTKSSNKTFKKKIILNSFTNTNIKIKKSNITYDKTQKTYTTHYTHNTITLTFSITKKTIKNNLYNKLTSKYTKTLTKSISNTKQIKTITPLIQNLPSTNNYNSNDTISLFSTNHTTINKTTIKNTLTTQTNLNKTSLKQTLINITNITNKHKLRVTTKKMKIIIPSTNQFNTKKINEISK